MAERKASSCYVLYIELDAPGGGDRRETFVYSQPSHVMSALRQELEGRLLGRIQDTLEAICTRGQSMTLAAVQRGKLVTAIDVRAHLRVRDEEGEVTPVDDLEAEWDANEHVARRANNDAKLVALELDEHAILESLPALEEPLATYGDTIAIAARPGERNAELTALAKQLKKGVTYGYADATGDFVSRERFEDPDPPPSDDIDAWMVQFPSARVAVEVAERIAARGDRETARRWVDKARREGLPITRIENVLRTAFAPPANAPPMRTPIRRVDMDVEAFGGDPRWQRIAEILRELDVQGTTATEERLRVLSRESDDADVAVVALMLRRHVGRARGAAHSALMLKQAMQRSPEAILPGIALGEELDETEEVRAVETLMECARRLEASGGELGAADTLLLKLLPTSFDARRIERAAHRLAKARGHRGAARILAVADRLVSDPADVAEIAVDRARLSIRAGAPEEARVVTEDALRYWEAHAWMRGPAPNDLRFWHALALAANGDRAELDAFLARAESYRAIAERELAPEAEQTVSAPSPAPPDDGSLRAGDRVSHAKFGLGTIDRVEGSGDSAKLAVKFDSGETKVLLGRFLRRA